MTVPINNSSSIFNTAPYASTEVYFFDQCSMLLFWTWFPLPSSYTYFLSWCCSSSSLIVSSTPTCSTCVSSVPPVSCELSLWASVCRGQLMVLCLLLFNRFTWISSITSPSGIMCFWSYTTETTCFLYFVPVPCHWLLLWRQTSRATERDSGSIVCFITHTPVCYTSSNRKPKGVWKKPFGIAMTHYSPGLKNNLSLSRAHPGVQPHVSGMYLWSDFCACGTVPTNEQNK